MLLFWAIIIIIIIPSEFFTQVEQVIFHWSPSDSKSPQISRTLLSILADLNNAVTWMISILPLISKFFSPLLSLRGSFRVHQLYLVSPSPLCSTAVLFLFFFCFVLFCFVFLLFNKVQSFVYPFAFFYIPFSSSLEQ